MPSGVRNSFKIRELTIWGGYVHKYANEMTSPVKVSAYLADLQGADLQKATLPGAVFIAADLTGANLQEANLQGANH